MVAARLGLMCGLSIGALIFWAEIHSGQRELVSWPFTVGVLVALAGFVGFVMWDSKRIIGKKRRP
jgi:hypothetical protein